MFGYTCFGLRIHSTLAFSELPVAELPVEGGEADVIVREGEVAVPTSISFEEGRYGEGTDREVLLVWRDTAACRIVDGREMVFQPLSGTESRWLSPYLLGPALGVLLHQRGLLVLHASAVALHGRVALFIGHKGAGKSTTAAGLHARGHALLSDDIVAIDFADPTQPSVLPGIPHQKLWPDTAEALGLDLNALPPIHPRLTKRSRHIEAETGRQPVPLHGVFALSYGGEHAIERLAPRTAFAEIIQHVYAARFIGKAGIPAWHFRQCVALTQAAPVYRFERRRSLEQLMEVLQILEATISPLGYPRGA